MTDDERTLLLACARAIGSAQHIPLSLRRAVREAMAPFVGRALPRAPLPPREETTAAVAVVARETPVVESVTAPRSLHVGIADAPMYGAAGTFAAGGAMSTPGSHESLTAIDGRLVPSRELK